MRLKRVVVVGAGAAGMMAAVRAAALGAEVLLLEKMETEGKKILVSGNTRCNLTNVRSLDDFIPMYGKNGRFLYAAFRRFFSGDLVELLAQQGVRTSTGPDGRVFPSSGKAADVVHALTGCMDKYGVKIIKCSPVVDIEQHDGIIQAVHTTENSFRADAVILATGGASYPQTGSSGDGYRIAGRLGHTIVKLRPALVPLEVKEKEVLKNLQGISLKNVRITSFSCEAKDIDSDTMPVRDIGRGIPGKSARPPVIESRTGDIVFTHYGVSGPAILLMALAVADSFDKGAVSLSIDMLPGMDFQQARQMLQNEFNRHGQRQAGTITGVFVPSRLADAVLRAAGVPGDKTAGQISSEERENIVSRLKDFRMNIKRTRPLAEAMVTAGGVCLDEVDPRTMESRLVRGLYFCGEVLDIDADTGGYNLQAAFSTGYLAGDSAARPG